jgi:hypothetical protein
MHTSSPARIARDSIPSCAAVGVFAAALLLAPRDAGAQEPKDHDDDDDDRVTATEREATELDDDDDDDDTRFRFHVDTEPLGGAWFDADGQGESSLSFGVGVHRPSLLDGGGNTVFMRPLVGIGFGWVFADERAILGTKLALTVDGYDLEDSDRLLAVGGRFVPYFHWMFLPDHRVRPYLEARFGLGGSAYAARDRDGE